MKSILSEQREADEELCESLEGLARDCRLSYGWEDIPPHCDRAIARIRALSADLQEACHERDGLLAKVPEWRPIETAPTNALVLLTWRDWRDGKWLIETGFASTGQRYDNGYSTVSLHGSATNWMLLPTPPGEE